MFRSFGILHKSWIFSDQPNGIPLCSYLQHSFLYTSGVEWDGVAVGLLSFGASIAAFLIVQPLADVALRKDKISIVAAALIPVLLLTCAWNERAMRRHADDASNRCDSA